MCYHRAMKNETGTLDSALVTREITFRKSLWEWITNEARTLGFEEPGEYVTHLLTLQHLRETGGNDPDYLAWLKTRASVPKPSSTTDDAPPLTSNH